MANDTSTDELKLLDCTLRDGGYYNQWDFPRELTEAYLEAVNRANIDVIEIGFRRVPKDRFLGAAAYSTDSYLETLILPKCAEIAVMIDAKDILSAHGGAVKTIGRLFDQRDSSPVSIVRIAANVNGVQDTQIIADELSRLGYRVCLNLMQSTTCTNDELANATGDVRKWGTVNVLYFADSLGNMKPIDVERIVDILKENWDGALGIHTHNNMGQAINNSLHAIDLGVGWIDATIRGMGRGAGNGAMECLLLEIASKYSDRYHPESLFGIATHEFAQLHSKFKWGSNLFYYLAGLHEIHPTYVQQMLSEDRYSDSDLFDVLQTLGQIGGQSFSQLSLQNAIAANYTEAEGSWSPREMIEGRPVLLIAAGPKAREHKEGIKTYIDKEQPVVIVLNFSDVIPPSMVTAYASCHLTRILSLADTYQKLKRPIITPIKDLPDSVQNKLSNTKILDFGLTIKAGEYEIRDTGCTSPVPLAASYVLSVCAAGKANKVLLAGFDGYAANDPRQDEMNDILEQYGDNSSRPPLIAVTPSSYNIKQSSIYSSEL